MLSRTALARRLCGCRVLTSLCPASATSSTPLPLRRQLHHGGSNQTQGPARSTHLDEQGGLKAVSFSGAGWLLPFHLGVLDGMRDAGLITDRTIFAGCSGGALAACSAAAQLHTGHLVDLSVSLGEQCRIDNRWLKGKSGMYLSQGLEDLITDDMPAKVEGKALIAVTFVPDWRLDTQLISSFRDRHDLIEALMASCHVPLYMDGKFFTRFRNRRAIDGGIPGFIPVSDTLFPDAVNVCALPPVVMAGRGIPVHVGPHLQDRLNLSLQELLAMAFRPPPTHMVHALYQSGHQSASVFIEQQALAKPTATSTGPAPTRE